MRQHFFRYVCFLDINFETFKVDLRLKFSKSQFAIFVENSTLFGIILGGTSLAFSALLTLYKSFNPSDLLARQQNFFQKLIGILQSLFYIWMASALFLVSIPIFTRGVGQKTPQGISEKLQKFPQGILKSVQDLHLISSYGLFRRENS